MVSLHNISNPNKKSPYDSLSFLWIYWIVFPSHLYDVDPLLFIMSMLYYSWLNCFSLWQGRTELGRKTKLNAERKKAESVRRHVATKGEKCCNLTSRPQPFGDS